MRRRGLWRVAPAALLLGLSVGVFGPGSPAQAVDYAPLAAGYKGKTEADRLVIHGTAVKRFGTYAVTIAGAPRRGVSVEVTFGTRFLAPADSGLVLQSNLTNSALLDYLLWKYANTSDHIQGAALHVVAWHLANQNLGSPSIGSTGPTTPGWGPPGSTAPSLWSQDPLVTAAGSDYTGNGTTLGDFIEAEARNLVTGKQDLLGPWTMDLSLSWGTKTGTVMVRSANNQPVGGVSVALSSLDSTVAPVVVTNSSGQATFGFTPVLDAATITATAEGPGVHAEYDASGSYQRIAVGNGATMTVTRSVKQAKITGSFAKDAVDGDKFVGAGGIITDTIQYQDLVPGATYTARVNWHYQDNAEASSLTTTTTFAASGTGAGSVDVGPITTGASEQGRALVAYQFLYAGADTSGFPEVIHANINDQDQTLFVDTVALIGQATDTYDGDNAAFAGASVMETVAYIGLAPGQKFTAHVDWHYVDGGVSQGSTGLMFTTTFFADPTGSGIIELGPVQLQGAQTGRSVVAMARIYSGETTSGIPLGHNESPANPQQTITVLAPSIFTVAFDTTDQDKSVEALKYASDEVIFANLHPGVTYTARLEFHYTNGAVDLGPTGLVATKTFTPTDLAGSITVGPVKMSGAVSGRQLVAYQRIYLGPTATGDPVVIHEIPFEPSQSIIVEEQAIFSDVTEGTAQGAAIPGDRDITLGQGATIVDTVSLNLAPGASVVVRGMLARYENGECGTPIATITRSMTIPASGIITMVHTVPEAPGQYVAYVVVTTPGGTELLQSLDCGSAEQRVTVVLGGGGVLPETL
jgi:hypothetical protein